MLNDLRYLTLVACLSLPALANAASCPANTQAIPEGANQAKVPDLDGDGQEDLLWMASGNRLGITTHGGATFSTTYKTSEASQVGARMVNLGGTPMIIFGGSRATKLYAVKNCKIVPTLNKQGKQYTFDNGFVTEGSGWGCVTVDGRAQLAGLQTSHMGKGDEYGIYRTLLQLGNGGASARNGTRSLVVGKLAHDTARSIMESDYVCPVSGSVMDP